MAVIVVSQQFVINVLCTKLRVSINNYLFTGKNYFTMYGNVIGEVDFKPLSNKEHWSLHEVCVIICSIIISYHM